MCSALYLFNLPLILTEAALLKDLKEPVTPRLRGRMSPATSDTKLPLFVAVCKLQHGGGRKFCNKVEHHGHSCAEIFLPTENCRGRKVH